MGHPFHVVIVGAGALGSFVGGLLSTQTRVTLLGREAHLRAVRERELRISGLTELILHPEVAFSPEEIKENGELPAGEGEKGMRRLFIFTVKGYDTERAVRDILPITDEESAFLTLQNGVGNEEVLRAHFPDERIIGGVTSHGITFQEPGQIIHAGKGETVIGAIRREGDPLAKEVSELFTDAGIETRVTRNICGEVWAKLIVNAAINPITAITGLKNGQVPELPELAETVKGVVGEAEETARAAGIRLPGCNMLEKTFGVLRSTADNRSSMLQDILNGKRTEIDSINGAVVRYAERLGRDVPLNRTLTALVKAIEGKENRENKNIEIEQRGNRGVK